MSREGAISGVQWEDRLLHFFRVELAPTPGRARAAARIMVLCVIAVALTMTCHTPHASFIIVTIFVVNQANAGASMIKAIWRVLGTIVGGFVGLVAYVAFLDHPWLRVALMGPLAAFFIFLSQTTTVPYFGLLGGITAVMIMSITGPDANTGLHVALWRFALIALGSFLATAAQVLLWPDDPEHLLYASLEERLGIVENIVSDVRDGRKPDTKKLDALLLTGLSRQLDLLDHAEARYAALRHRHAEQVALIAGIERLLTATVAFARVAGDSNLAPSAPAISRLSGILNDCGRLRTAINTRQPIGQLDGGRVAASDMEVAGSGSAALLPGILDMEGAIYGLPGVTGCLERKRQADAMAPGIATLDSPGRASFFTPAFSLANVDAIVFSVRAGLCATIAYVLYQGMAWPGLETSVWTALLISQSTLGASVQKFLLRFLGAVIGGLMGLFMIILFTPNMDNLAPLLVVVAFCTGVAGWLAVGSARISYVGMQIGLAFALAILNDLGPTTDLVPARDRVIGILLGTCVWAFVFGLTGAVIAGIAMRRSLATTLRSLAGLARVGLRGEPSLGLLRPALGWRWSVYQNLTTTLRLQDESKFEWGARGTDAEAERVRVVRLATDTQDVFLAILALIHHRLGGNLAVSPPALHAELQKLAEGVVSKLEALANRIQGRSEGPSPALNPLFSRVQTVAQELAPELNDLLRTHVPGRVALYGQLLARINQLDRDASPVAASESPKVAPGSAPIPA